MRWSGFLSIGLMFVTFCLSAQEEHPLKTLMRKLPKVAIAEPVESTVKDLQPIIPGLSIVKQKRVYLNAQIIFDQGPQDGLEAIACMPGGKNHESMMVLECANGALIKSMLIANLGVYNGVVSAQDSGLPVRGVPVRTVMRWQPDPVLEPELWHERDMSTMVRDRVSGQPYPPLPYMYTGSRFLTQLMKEKDGQEVERELFMLDSTKTLITNYDEPDTLLASPFPLAQFDILFEVNGKDSPPENAKVELFFEAAQLPLTLDMDKEGVLYMGPKLLNPEDVVALLKQHYSEASKPALRAVGVRVAKGTPRDKDVAAREYLMQQAVVAQVWAVPVFIASKD